jgi:hypothetical protein
MASFMGDSLSALNRAERLRSSSDSQEVVDSDISTSKRVIVNLVFMV